MDKHYSKSHLYQKVIEIFSTYQVTNSYCPVAALKELMKHGLDLQEIFVINNDKEQALFLILRTAIELRDDPVQILEYLINEHGLNLYAPWPDDADGDLVIFYILRLALEIRDNPIPLLDYLINKHRLVLGEQWPNGQMLSIIQFVAMLAMITNKRHVIEYLYSYGLNMQDEVLNTGMNFSQYIINIAINHHEYTGLLDNMRNINLISAEEENYILNVILGLDIDKFNENTMSSILHASAHYSEQILRNKYNFPLSTMGSTQEDKLINSLKNFLSILAASNQVEAGEAIVALRALNSKYHYNSNTGILCTHSGTEYGIRNVVALYWHVITLAAKDAENSKKILYPQVSIEAAQKSIVFALANGLRGNNRNNIDGKDDGEQEDKPICIDGKYNKIAEEFVSILQDVVIIFDASGFILEALQNLLAELLIKFLTKYRNFDAPDIINSWNNFIYLPNNQETSGNIFMKWIKEQNCLENELKHKLSIEFSYSQEIQQSIIERLDIMFKSYAGDIYQLIEEVNISEEIFYQILQKKHDQQVELITEKSRRKYINSNLNTSSINHFFYQAPQWLKSMQFQMACDAYEAKNPGKGYGPGAMMVYKNK